MWARFQKRNSQQLYRITILVGLSLFVILISWLVAIGLFGKPVLDDVSFKVLIDEYGILGYFKYHLLTVNGRIADAAVISLLYGFFGLSHVPFAGLVAVTSLFVCFCFFYRHVLRLSWTLPTFVLITGSVLATYFTLQIPYHSFYWMPSVFTYVIPAALMGTLLYLLFSKKPRQYLLIALLYICLLAVGTFNELLTLISLLCLGLWLLTMNRSKTFLIQALPAGVTLLISFSIMYFAPGATQRRATTSTGSSDIFSLFVESIVESGTLLLQAMGRPGILILLLTALIAASQFKRYIRSNKDTSFLAHLDIQKLLLFTSLLVLGTSYTTAFVANYTNSVEGGMAAPRTHIFFVLTLVAWLSFCFLVIIASRPVSRFVTSGYGRLLTAIIFLFIATTFFVTPLLQDDAIQLTGRYHLWVERERSIYNQKIHGIDTPAVEPLPIELLSDLVPFPHFYNEDLTKYYDVDSLKSLRPQSLWYREY